MITLVTGGARSGKSDFAEKIVAEKAAALARVLAEDPRPAYQEDPEREYAFEFAGRTVRFRVAEGTLRVTSVGD